MSIVGAVRCRQANAKKIKLRKQQRYNEIYIDKFEVGKAAAPVWNLHCERWDRSSLVDIQPGTRTKDLGTGAAGVASGSDVAAARKLTSKTSKEEFFG